MIFVLLIGIFTIGYGVIVCFTSKFTYGLQIIFIGCLFIAIYEMSHEIKETKGKIKELRDNNDKINTKIKSLIKLCNIKDEEFVKAVNEEELLKNVALTFNEMPIDYPLITIKEIVVNNEIVPLHTEVKFVSKYYDEITVKLPFKGKEIQYVLNINDVENFYKWQIERNDSINKDVDI